MNHQYPTAEPPAVPSAQFRRRDDPRLYQAAAVAFYHPPSQQAYIQAHTPPPPPVVVRSPHPHQVTKPPPPPPTPPPPPPPPLAPAVAPTLITAVTPTPVIRQQYQPPLPWYSAPNEPFPMRRRRRRRRAPTPAAPIPTLAPASVTEEKTPLVSELPTPRATKVPLTASDILTPTTTHPPSEAGSANTVNLTSTAPPSATITSAPTSAATSATSSATTSATTLAATTPIPTSTAVVHKPAPAVPTPTLPPVPIIKPKAPKAKAAPKPPTESVKPVPTGPSEPTTTPKDTTPKDATTATPPVPAPTAVTTNGAPAELAAAPPQPLVQQKSWADLVKTNNTVTTGPKTEQRVVVIKGNGDMTGSMAEILNNFVLPREKDVASPFLEPRGLVNTGNMCFMNAVLQMLVFCRPFYYFLDHLRKQVAHSFKTDTPLIDAMIMFMREFRVVSPASSQSQAPTLKSKDLETFGEPFVPEFLYEVIRNMQSFAHMKRGHQQDAEEFLGFLLDGLHEEAIKVMSKGQLDGSSTPTKNGTSTPTEEASGSGWLEVGYKQRTVTTRTTEIIESPITKIFGGRLRSEFRVPGLKPSVTFEPYTPLQLDIQSPEVKSVTDALKHMAVAEKLQGDYHPAKGPNVAATKQVQIETLPPVLILQLKRFQYDNTSGVQKIWKRIGYPLVLEIPPEAMSHTKRAGPPQKYRLIGVVYHHGKSASGGHYTVDVQRQDAKSWIRLDDTVIKRVGSGEVRIDVRGGEEGEEDGWVNAAWEEVNGAGGRGTGEGAKWVGEGGKVAYILFYQKF